MFFKKALEIKPDSKEIELNYKSVLKIKEQNST